MMDGPLANRQTTPPAVTPATSGRVIAAAYTHHAEAQRAVDLLADRNFPVAHTAIVAEGLRFVEQVTGRHGWGQALMAGALSGALAGAFFGFIFGLFDWVSPVTSALLLLLYGAVFGAIIGAAFGALTYAITAGRRDFTSVGGFQAERYTVLVDPELAEEARRLLAPLAPHRADERRAG